MESTITAEGSIVPKEDEERFREVCERLCSDFEDEHGDSYIIKFELEHNGDGYDYKIVGEKD